MYLGAITFRVVGARGEKERDIYVCMYIRWDNARIFWVILSIIKEFRSWRTRNASVNSFFKRNFTLYVSCKQLKKSYTRNVEDSLQA